MLICFIPLKPHGNLPALARLAGVIGAIVLTLLSLTPCMALDPTDAPEGAEPPNIVLIMVDDLGFSDLGCYGSEIETPNLDRLAENGLRFSQFYNTAKCHSSRVSLLTGRWCRQAGDESMRRGITIPEVLHHAGYQSVMTGKWHLDKQPTDFGFSKYFGHLSGATHYFKGDNTFRLNGEPWTVPESGFYTTVANVDYAIQFLDEAREVDQPWFLYLAFNAPHAPLHPLKEDYEKYLGRYEVGWDQVRDRRVARQKELGILKPDDIASERPAHVPAWDSLTDELKRWEERRMTALAAMIDRVDQEVGRLLDDLKRHGEADNTMIVFVSDNGACPYDRTSRRPDLEPYDRETSWSDSTGWAWARNAPFRFYKQNQYEGGIASPCVVSWPAGLKARSGSITDQPAHLVDWLPTFAEIAGTAPPTSFPGREWTPLSGTSLTPVLDGKRLKQRPPIHLLFASDRGLRMGPWKLVSFRGQPWELYHLEADRTERINVANKYPERVKSMIQVWNKITRDDLRAPVRSYRPLGQQAKEKVHKEWSDYSGQHGSVTTRRKTARRNTSKRQKPKAKSPGGDS